MTATLIISFFLLAFASYTAIRTKRSSSRKEIHDGLLQKHPVSLFQNTGDASSGDTHDGENAQLELERQQRADALRARASEGDATVLLDAHRSGDVGLYDMVLDALVAEAAPSAVRLDKLASFIVERRELRANPALAAALSQAWRDAPDPASTARLLHVAALSNDSAAYEQAVETVFALWREAKLPGVSADELVALFDAEYWVLSDDARRAGAGFVLKQKLTDVRRQLQTNANMRRRQSNTPEAT